MACWMFCFACMRASRGTREYYGWENHSEQRCLKICMGCKRWYRVAGCHACMYACAGGLGMHSIISIRVISISAKRELTFIHSMVACMVCTEKWKRLLLLVMPACVHAKDKVSTLGIVMVESSQPGQNLTNACMGCIGLREDTYMGP